MRNTEILLFSDTLQVVSAGNPEFDEPSHLSFSVILKRILHLL